MILERLRIESFAGLADREIAFGEGLNVILGPNEAGKSTLFQAIRHTLLTKAGNRRRPLETFFPLGGGDSIACSVQFLHGGQKYLLAKRWGEGGSAELVLPNGSQLRGEEQIRTKLAELLPAGEGTLRTVFLAAQSALAGTLKEMDSEAVRSLADLLRRAVLQPDGMSISLFQEKLAEGRQQLLGRWDLDRQRPEGNRGLDNRWQKDLGEVTKSWYEREELERRRGEAGQAENRLGEAARALQSCSDELEQLKRRVRDREPAANAIWKRRSLEKDLELRRAALKGLQDDYDLWPRLEHSLTEADRDLPTAAGKVSALQNEKRRAEAAERRRQMRELLEQARKAEDEAKRARNRLSRLPALRRAELEALENASAEAERAALALQALADGQGITLSFQARADIRLQVSKDGEPAGSRALGAGETLTLKARQRVRLEAQDWTLKAAGTPEDPEELRSKAESARRRFTDLLAVRGLPSLQSAKQASLDFEVAAREVGNAENRLRDVLAGHSLEELEHAAFPDSAAEEEKGGSPPRPLAEVLQELCGAEDRLGVLQKRKDEDGQVLARLAQEHGGRQALLQRIVAETSAIEEVRQVLAALPALPPEASNPEQFLELHQAEKTLLEQKEALGKRLTEEHLRAEAQLPEESAEELAGRLADADRRHRQALRRARALLSIEAAAKAVLGESGSGSQERFERELGRYAAELTAERYRAMPLSESLPAEMERRDGLRLPFELLSGGTRGLFALALRLAMAELFLEDGEGFLILDDPLVDLDPDRQARASAVLARFAERPGRQVLLFTCHPAHAARFPQAHLIELG
jgi:exonuclease SbcC